ncbi:MAG TPA: UDP-N-acetylglucosamine 2-epimerase (non-hydrolyzing) [Conexibacter sp.]|jgi:UDP-N-acetylglucosamine 2-epimerase (non-hydrolysing)|nr:UDP-N-acetylglucosamine 2-epimerase (non-hydrolyzing) [Conexibacter sp.]
MKILTILGTRPEIIRLSRVIERLDAGAEHVLVHTGQNYDAGLSDVFFEELGVRAPDHHLGIRGATFGARVAAIVERIEALLREERPDRLLVLGDTDSGLAAIVAKRLGIQVLHMEAGNRCFDDRVPEEVNRRIIDHASDLLLPYTEGSRRNLLREGIDPQRILVTGNPINEVLQHYAEPVAAAAEGVLARLGVEPGGFLLLTAHRQETVDVEPRLRALVTGVLGVAEAHDLPVVASVHPRTRSRLEAFGVPFDDGRLLGGSTFGFFEFVALERAARCVLTDSGTVQEEACIFGVPAVTLRDTTERPETLECGSNVLSGVEPEAIARATAAALAGSGDWTPPAEYLATDVSATVARIALGR